MSLTKKTVKELYEIASVMGVKNYKKYRKAELIILLLDLIAKERKEKEEEVAIVETVHNESIVNKIANKVRSFFRFDHNRANVGDYFTKRMGESKVALKVAKKDEKSTTLVTNKGIRLKILK